MSQAPTESVWVSTLLRFIARDIELAMNRGVRVNGMVLVLSETARKMLARVGRLEALGTYGVAVVVDPDEFTEPFKLVEI